MLIWWLDKDIGKLEGFLFDVSFWRKFPSELSSSNDLESDRDVLFTLDGWKSLVSKMKTMMIDHPSSKDDILFTHYNIKNQDVLSLLCQENECLRTATIVRCFENTNHQFLDKFSSFITITLGFLTLSRVTNRISVCIKIVRFEKFFMTTLKRTFFSHLFSWVFTVISTQIIRNSIPEMSFIPNKILRTFNILLQTILRSKSFKLWKVYRDLKTFCAGICNNSSVGCNENAWK